MSDLHQPGLQGGHKVGSVPLRGSFLGCLKTSRRHFQVGKSGEGNSGLVDYLVNNPSVTPFTSRTLVR